MIKRDTNGYAIDHFTNTVEDAAEFEFKNNSHLYYSYDNFCDDSDKDSDDNFDSCNCSDPCCPCSGRKIGIP